jgi:stress-induced morphogen
LKKVLSRQFPPPATVKLEDHDGVIRVITSAQFAGMETIDRQDLIGNILATHLSAEERRRVQVIVGVTPDEGTGYLSGE